MEARRQRLLFTDSSPEKQNSFSKLQKPCHIHLKNARTLWVPSGKLCTGVRHVRNLEEYAQLAASRVMEVCTPLIYSRYHCPQISRLFDAFCVILFGSTDHEQVELFPKRNFQCDCPTSCLNNQCQLHKVVEPPNTHNAYSQNFSGKFCRCGRPYDATTEEETMVQCVACEVVCSRTRVFRILITLPL